VNTPERPSAPAPLTPAHDLASFDCGTPALDAWLQRRALANEVAGASRTFVIEAGGRVVGYYSLAATSILHGAATGKARRNMPDPIPAVLVARLALDKSMQGHGHGIGLLRDAVLRVAGAAQTIGVRVVLVHAISNAAKAFYERCGFRASPLDPLTLMITIEEAQRLIG
jgi:GNAT superfamily N-acetyltransferase